GAGLTQYPVSAHDRSSTWMSIPTAASLCGSFLRSVTPPRQILNYSVDSPAEGSVRCLSQHAGVRGPTMTSVVSPSLVEEYDAFLRNDPTVLEDPHPLFARLREEAPVFRHPTHVAITRYED